MFLKFNRLFLRYACLTKNYSIDKKCVSALGETIISNNEQDVQAKQIGITRGDQKSLLRQRPEFREDMKTLKVALIGAPNVGKSTLANCLIGWKFSPVSQKVHTTRQQTLGVLTEENKQVIFLDTPGIILPSKIKKHNLEMSLLVDPHKALNDSEMIVVVVDVSFLWHRTHLDHEILKMLVFHKNKPSILVLNKVDLLKSKQELLNVARVLTQGCLEGEKYQHTQAALKKQNMMLDLDLLFKQDRAMNPDVEKIKNSEDENDFDIKLHHDQENSDVASDTKTSSNSIEGSYELERADHPAEQTEDLNSDIKNHDKLESEIFPSSNIFNNLNLHNEVHWQMYYRRLEEIGRKMRDQYGWPHFQNVFMISALTGDGIFELRNHLLESTLPSRWSFNGNVITNQDPKTLARQIVWEKLLDNLPEEVPYQIDVNLSLWEIGDDDLLRAQFELRCTRRRHVNKIIGKDGETIQKISREAKQGLMNAFHREMTLKLVVKGTQKTKPRFKKE